MSQDGSVRGGGRRGRAFGRLSLAERAGIEITIEVCDYRYAIPSFFAINPLIYHEPPKEMFGKSLEGRKIVV
jgi:hypothetical protein